MREGIAVGGGVSGFVVRDGRPWMGWMVEVYRVCLGTIMILLWRFLY